MPEAYSLKEFSSFYLEYLLIALKVSHQIQTVRRIVVYIAGISKSGLFVDTQCGGVIFFDADLNAVVFPLVFKFGKNQPQSLCAKPFTLIPSVDHELLQIIAGRLFIKVFDPGNPYDCVILGNSDDSGTVVPVDVASCEDADSAVEKGCLGIAD